MREIQLQNARAPMPAPGTARYGSWIDRGPPN
jgi:hypothetical protein